MNKKLLFSFALAVFLLIFAVNLVSAYHYDYGYYPDYRTSNFRDITDNSHTTVSSFRDRYNSESIRTTTTTRVEVRRSSRTPTYGYSSYGYHSPSYRSSYSPYSNWRYKEPYNYYNPYHRDSRYSYYYQPRYDYQRGHYNWRY